MNRKTSCFLASSGNCAESEPRSIRITTCLAISWPGLQTGAQRAAADKYLTRGYGALIGFELVNGRSAGSRFVDSLQLRFHQLGRYGGDGQRGVLQVLLAELRRDDDFVQRLYVLGRERGGCRGGDARSDSKANGLTRIHEHSIVPLHWKRIGLMDRSVSHFTCGGLTTPYGWRATIPQKFRHEVRYWTCCFST